MIYRPESRQANRLAVMDTNSIGLCRIAVELDLEHFAQSCISVFEGKEGLTRRVRTTVAIMHHAPTTMLTR